MACERWREAVSAAADGEDPFVDPRLLDAHLASCSSCRRFQADVEATRAAFRVHAAEPMPDLSGRVVRANAVADRRSPWALARVALAVVAAEVLVFSVPDLLGRGDEASVHAARHLGAFSVAYATMLLVVVVRPSRARIVLPVAMVLGGALALTGVIDLAAGRVPWVGEATHLPELLSVGLLWWMARTPARRAGDEQALHLAARRLRLVARPQRDQDVG